MKHKKAKTVIIDSGMVFNEFYLNRYFKFLENCKYNDGDDVHIHHILPSKLFPAYKRLKKYKWNSVTLTHRQHFIAHWMLWKAISCIQTAYAFTLMSYMNGTKINSKSYAIVRNYIKETCPPPDHSGKTYMYNITTKKNKRVDVYDITLYESLGWKIGYYSEIVSGDELRKKKAKDNYNSNPKKWYCIYDVIKIGSKYNLGRKALECLTQFKSIPLPSGDVFDICADKASIRVDDSFFNVEAWKEWISSYEPSEEVLVFRKQLDVFIDFLESEINGVNTRYISRWVNNDQIWGNADKLYNEWKTTGKIISNGLYTQDIRERFRKGWIPEQDPSWLFYNKWC